MWAWNASSVVMGVSVDMLDDLIWTCRGKGVCVVFGRLGEGLTGGDGCKDLDGWMEDGQTILVSAYVITSDKITDFCRIFTRLGAAR